MLYLFIGYYCNEIMRGICDTGNFHLTIESQKHRCSPSLLSLVKSDNSDGILQKMKKFIEDSPSPSVNSLAAPTAFLDTDENEDSNQSLLLADNLNNRPSSTSTTISTVVRKTLTTGIRSALMVDQDCVKFDGDKKVFIVESLDLKNVYVVYLNMPVKHGDNKVNAGADRKRTIKEAKEGTPGGKVPRRIDKAANKIYERLLLAKTSSSSTNTASSLSCTTTTMTTRNILQPITNLVYVQTPTTIPSSIISSTPLLPSLPNQQIRRPRFEPRYNYVSPALVSQKLPEHVFSWINRNFTEKEKVLEILSKLRREAYQSHAFWRFSTTSLHPGEPSIPGMIDQSFEEVRWGYLSCPQDQTHIYKDYYRKHWEDAEKRLLQLSRLDEMFLNEIKPLIEAYICRYKPTQQQETISMSYYTPRNQLRPEDLNAFESDKFELGHIPSVPPSQNLCR
ncbi:unnamed protein product [Didymodactylos carnosus]|uniref:Uncharacterized protein n=1 Tax=Didymodactylos carnosus TaxID=1234261 RepID=A0A815DF02_9BILA|nr:unnamed protein product [Didymodactylos carnosus]CAF4101589.1 unnamed protein product [Didymodactylos carnosus]